MTNFRNKNNALAPGGGKLKRIKALPGTMADEVTTKAQHEDGSMSPVYDDLTVNGTFTAAALNVDSVAPAITAKAGGGQDATLALSKNLNIVTTVATARDSVTLPAAVVGLRITIVNLGANTLDVFPYTSDSIDDVAVDSSVTIQPESTVTFNCYTAVKWQSNTESLTVFDKAYITGLLYESLTTGITAFATGGQASATALTKNINNVTTCATAGDSVALPSAETGLRITVKNSGAAACDIFPASGDSIDALAVNLAVRIQPGSQATFFAISATVWESNVDETFTLVAPTTNTGALVLKAVASAGNFNTTVKNASQAAAREYTIPDAGANASFAMTEGAQTINGVQTFGSPNVYKSATTLTALAGGAQAGTALAAEYNEFTVVASASDSAQLPTPVLGTKRVVRNSATSKLPMVVFGQTGASINTGAANAGVIIGYGETVVFTAISATVWKTDIGSADATVSGIITEERAITSAEIVGTSAGDLGHANGVTVVEAPASGYALEFISALVIYDFDTAAYTGGGDDTFFQLGGGGAAITGIVTSANLLGAAGDKIARFDPLSAAALPVSVGVGISLKSTTAWTQPGTAAGVLRVQTSYRIHKTGL